MRALIVSAVVAIALAASGATPVRADEGSGAVCGPPRAAYRCGAILVILEADTTDSIAEVIRRMGGDPASDILQEFRAVRDLLDPDGIADDLSEAIVYSVRVPVGEEIDTARAYGSDPAVHAAAPDRETIGIIGVPDTALAGASDPHVIVGIALVLIGLSSWLRRGRGAAA